MVGRMTTGKDLGPGVVVGQRYRIEELIGRGGFGAVFRATQVNLGRAVALKVLLPETGDDARVRFQREAELVQRLDHPHVVRLLDFGHADDGAPYLVFEYLAGSTLEQALRAGGRMPPSRVARIAAQILKALMEAHAAAVVHRDLKPANVMLCSYQGEPDFVKVLDFGIAKQGGASALTQQGMLLGTPAYMAPEQILSRPPTPATDLYALGVLMSEALAGKPLFAGMALGEIVQAHTSASPLPHPPEVLASRLGPVIHRATQKDPDRRYPSAAAMLADLEASRAHDPAANELAPTPAMPVPHLGLPPPAPRAVRQRSRAPWIVGAATIVVAAGTGAVLVARSDAGRPSASRPPALPALPEERDDGSPITGTTRLGQLTVDSMIQRLQAAGYDIYQNAVTALSGGGTLIHVTAKVRDCNIYVNLSQYPKPARALDDERIFKDQEDRVVLRQDSAFVMVGADKCAGGRPAARRLLRVLVR
jgi:serine/threonine-protein kinase